MGIDRRSVIFESSYVTKREQGTAAENLRDFNTLPHGRIRCSRTILQENVTARSRSLAVVRRKDDNFHTASAAFRHHRARPPQT
jgi:hypothetical protein